MQDIFEQLKAEGQRCQPEFSESLHARCKEAIDQIEASRSSTASAGVPSRNSLRGLKPTANDIEPLRGSSGTLSRLRNIFATRNFPVWQAVAAVVLFCVGFAMFNSFFLPPSNTTLSLPSEPQQIAADAQEFQPLVINPMALEQLELETFAQSFDRPDQVEHQETKGRSAGVFGSVKKMIQTPAPAKTVAASIMRQDISMGNLLVKAGSLAQFPEDNSDDNPEENE